MWILSFDWILVLMVTFKDIFATLVIFKNSFFRIYNRCFWKITVLSYFKIFVSFLTGFLLWTNISIIWRLIIVVIITLSNIANKPLDLFFRWYWLREFLALKVRKIVLKRVAHLWIFFLLVINFWVSLERVTELRFLVLRWLYFRLIIYSTTSHWRVAWWVIVRGEGHLVRSLRVNIHLILVVVLEVTSSRGKLWNYLIIFRLNLNKPFIWKVDHLCRFFWLLI